MMKIKSRPSNQILYLGSENYSGKKIVQELKEAGYDYAIAAATQAEIKAGAACGQLSIITESN